MDGDEGDEAQFIKFFVGGVLYSAKGKSAIVNSFSTYRDRFRINAIETHS